MDLALFDFDGTITTVETFPVFMRRAVPRRRLVVGGALLSPLFACYKLGVVSGERVRAAMVDVGLRGVSEARVRDAGRAFVRDYLPGVIRPRAIERIHWHKARGDAVAIVSAALDLYLLEWARPLDVEVVCSRLASRHGVLTGRYDDADCCGLEKSSRIRARFDLQRYGEVYAYGDTVEDIAMLSLATRRFFRWEEQPS